MTFNDHHLYDCCSALGTISRSGIEEGSLRQVDHRSSILGERHG
jgi:hypothetical protein